MDYSFNDGIVKNLNTTYDGIGDIARNIEIRTSFWGDTYNGGTLSALDIDSFSIVPEPATMALLAFGGILLRTRKRYEQND